MAAEVDVSDGGIHIHVSGIDKVRALKRQLDVPFASVKNAWVDDAATLRSDITFKEAGAGLGSNVTAGIFRGETAQKQFWVVHKADRVVVQVEDPDALVNQIHSGESPG